MSPRERGQIESTADAFYAMFQLEVTMDDVPHLTQRWVRTTARHLL